VLCSFEGAAGWLVGWLFLLLFFGCLGSYQRETTQRLRTGGSSTNCCIHLSSTKSAILP
jgi:hypothetical protein